MRLMEGANIYQIAKNCRTSVGMIEKYYGVHVKNSLNAAAINVVRSGLTLKVAILISETVSQFDKFIAA